MPQLSLLVAAVAALQPQYPQELFLRQLPVILEDSIRLPSALCEVIGFRPSLGRYPAGAITPISHTRDVTGPIALDMSLITLLDSVLADRPEVNTPVDIGSLRLGIARIPYYQNLHPEVATQMQMALDKLRHAGVTLIEADMPELLALTEKSAATIALYEFINGLSSYLAEFTPAIDFFTIAEKTSSPDVKNLMVLLSTDQDNDGQPDGLFSKQQYQQAMTIYRPAIIALYQRYFREHTIDALVFPTTILPAAPIQDNTESIQHNGQQLPTFNIYIRNTDSDSIAGMPGISLPIGLTSKGLPIGMELDALPGEDEKLLSIALAIEPLFEQLPAPELLDR